MCEYCGCQSLTSIAELTREHDAVVALISRVRSARGEGDTAGTAAPARRIAAVLEEEHRRIGAVLAEAGGGVPADPARPDRLLDVLALLREHILKEQDGVFPAAPATLTAEQWEDVEAVRARAGSALPRPAA